MLSNILAHWPMLYKLSKVHIKLVINNYFIISGLCKRVPETHTHTHTPHRCTYGNLCEHILIKKEEEEEARNNKIHWIQFEQNAETILYCAVCTFTAGLFHIRDFTWQLHVHFIHTDTYSLKPCSTFDFYIHWIHIINFRLKKWSEN